MLTKDDLKAVVDSMSPLIRAEGAVTRKDLKNYIDENNRIIGQIVQIDLSPEF